LGAMPDKHRLEMFRFAQHDSALFDMSSSESRGAK